MRIDNSMYSLYCKCPLAYFERYHGLLQQNSTGNPSRESEVHAGEGSRNIQQSASGIELAAPSESLDFGTRFHQLLHLRRLRLCGDQQPVLPEWPDDRIESECQSTLAQYDAFWRGREYTYLESERTHVLPLPGSEGRHELVVKLDAICRFPDGTIGPFDSKSENRPGYNTREDWAGRTQAKLYLHASKVLYPDEHVSSLCVDVITRGSPKGRRSPIFSRIEDIGSSQAAIDDALRNVLWVADDIQRSLHLGWFRSNMNACKRGWDKCDYYNLHVYGRTEHNLKLYKIAEEYLKT